MLQFLQECCRPSRAHTSVAYLAVVCRLHFHGSKWGIGTSLTACYGDGYTAEFDLASSPSDCCSGVLVQYYPVEWIQPAVCSLMRTLSMDGSEFPEHTLHNIMCPVVVYIRNGRWVDTCVWSASSAASIHCCFSSSYRACGGLPACKTTVGIQLQQKTMTVPFTPNQRLRTDKFMSPFRACPIRFLISFSCDVTAVCNTSLSR